MRKASWAVVLLFVSLSIPSLAQKFTGTLTGTVTDQSGAVVAGASVKATSKTTGATRTTMTNNGGSYTFPELNPDNYDVSFSKAGFKQVVHQNVALHVADNLSLNA